MAPESAKEFQSTFVLGVFILTRCGATSREDGLEV